MVKVTVNVSSDLKKRCAGSKSRKGAKGAKWDGRMVVEGIDGGVDERVGKGIDGGIGVGLGEGINGGIGERKTREQDVHLYFPPRNSARLIYQHVETHREKLLLFFNHQAHVSLNHLVLQGLPGVSIPLWQG